MKKFSWHHAASLEGMSKEISVYFCDVLVRVGELWLGRVYLLRDGAGELRAVGSVWSVGVDGNDEVGKLPVDECAQGRQAEEKGEKG